MLRRLSSYFKQNVVGFLSLFVALGGTAYAVNTVRSTDIVDGEVKSVDIGNNEIGSNDIKDNSVNTFDVHSFLGVDIVDGTVTSADLAFDAVGDGQLQADSVDSAEILDGGLIDRDLAETAFRNFAADIGVVNSQNCVNRTVTGGGLGGNHLLLTPSIGDSNGALEYTAKFDTQGNRAYIHVCNWTAANIDDGITHFNLLSINGIS